MIASLGWLLVSIEAWIIFGLLCGVIIWIAIKNPRP